MMLLLYDINKQTHSLFVCCCCFYHCFCVILFQLNNAEGITLIHPEKDASEPRSSMISASFNFINSIIGSGIIGKYSLNHSNIILSNKRSPFHYMHSIIWMMNLIHLEMIQLNNQLHLLILVQQAEAFIPSKPCSDNPPGII